MAYNNPNQLPLLTVIIPAYNVADYVVKCVHSVMAQTYTNLEILLVDDGSTDQTGVLCDQLAQEDARIQVFHTENHGLSAARNEGLDHAHGVLVGFVDSDDWIESDMYEFLYQQLVKYDADVSVCAHYIDKGNKIRCKRQVNHPIVCDKDKTMDMLMTDKILHNYAWDKLYKLSLFEGLRYPEKVLYEDIAFTYKIFNRCSKVVIYALPKYHYTVRPGSIVSARYTVQRNYSYFCAEEQLMTFMVENGYQDGARHLVRRGIHTLKRLILSNATDEMLQDILKRLQPYHYIGIRQIGVANTWRRYMMENHLDCYKKLYKWSKRMLRVNTNSDSKNKQG
ncbi:MAG: glycosyltransferase [Paludibacteraceae bacterium]|nr:glycosyltransferase [Paludibacteraceae bacterium]